MPGSIDPIGLMVTKNAYFSLLAQPLLVTFCDTTALQECVTGWKVGKTEGQTDIKVEIVM